MTSKKKHPVALGKFEIVYNSEWGGLNFSSQLVKSQALMKHKLEVPDFIKDLGLRQISGF